MPEVKDRFIQIVRDRDLEIHTDGEPWWVHIYVHVYTWIEVFTEKGDE